MAFADPYVAVERALDQDARAKITEEAYAANPGLRGSDVADILATAVDIDAYLTWREDFFDEHGAVLAGSIGTNGHELVQAAVVAVVLLMGYGGQEAPAELPGKFIVTTRELVRAANENEPSSIGPT